MCSRLDTRQQEQGVQQEQDVKRAQTVDGLVALETRAVPHDPDELRYYPALTGTTSTRARQAPTARRCTGVVAQQ